VGAPESEQAKNRTKMKVKAVKDLFLRKKQTKAGRG